MFSTIDGERSARRHIKSWDDCVRDDLDAIGLKYDWWRKCKDREYWKTSIEVLLKRT